MRTERTDVLVVGAGPVGLWTALLLAEKGLEVTLIDREDRTTARSYACALHPATLRLLERFGLAKTLVEQGRKIPTVAFYDRQQRQAELSLAKGNPDYPFLLVLPQSHFESALETQLHKAGVKVHWNHRFDSVAPAADGLTVDVEELAGTSTGYIVPHWEMTVKNRTQIRAQGLVGADGNHSLVRQRTAIESTRVGHPLVFAAYEFQSDRPGDDEIRVVMDDSTTNVLWPLLGNRFRWTFQLKHPAPDPEFPEKERIGLRASNRVIDEQIRQHVEKIASVRAPWFSVPVQEILWCTQVVFENRMVNAIRQGPCWLAGDAAHQTGPVGVQSMNAAFQETSRLASILPKYLQAGTGEDELKSAEQDQLNTWRSLLGMTGPAHGTASAWVQKNSDRIRGCLPGIGPAFTELAGQLKLTYP